MTDPQSDTVQVYRVVTANEKDKPFSPSQRDARWTSKTSPVVYTSLSPSGAMLEFLVHRESTLTEGLCLATAQLPASSIQHLSDPPPKWEERPYRKEVQAVGDTWLQQRESLALKVPSAVCSGECNLLINPAHRDFALLAVVSVKSFSLDSRLG
ncbi:RES family NAD+ phosphorylase [Pseudoxanthomonas sp. UTMC 1351]|uniref:RES family NAD+ phosphorylase n=1 Tax=Pseudoxanthomonas sp. UTMC 1351 TaxID=2695853 RepID=UPI0034CD129A